MPVQDWGALRVARGLGTRFVLLRKIDAIRVRATETLRGTGAK
jgi:hypothetical protein